MDVQELMRIAAHCAKAYGRRCRLQRADVEDVGQDVLLKLVRAVRKHDPDKVPLRPFLFLVGYRQAKDSVTRLMTRRRQERQLVAGHLRPLRERPRLDDADEVAFLMRGLPPKQRATIEGCFLGGLSQVDYSARGGSRRSVACMSINRAIKNMRRKAALAEGGAPR
ncbi:MAG TPA: sigma-70 family RNA polymerase sigma factor [Urbifossiella sp.]|nr:sigma-70 family RNA polymerase sigma factor [Urbifossiella sp.]